MLPGFATLEGTASYRDRFGQLRAAQHFRRPEHVPGPHELWLSSIGLGTYLGEPDDATDARYIAAITRALTAGINVLDTAINYRHQRSERNIGTALAQLIASGELRRDEVFVCTKAGYLSFDGSMPADPRGYFQREYLEPGILDAKDLAGGMHCIAPAYLENQIERSCRNLDLETLDLFYLHNPESQLADVSPEVFRQRLKDAFTLLEKLVKSSRIRFYGMATWNAFRVAPDARDSISLIDAVDIAEEVAGEDHHFRFIQLPFNLGMPEAFSLANQSFDKKFISTLAAATRLRIAAIGSATLHQGSLTHGLPEFVGKILGQDNDAANAIQFSRSAPGLITSLIGMSRVAHVNANLQPALSLPADEKTWMKLFQQ